MIGDGVPCSWAGSQVVITLQCTGSGSFYEQSCRCLGDQLDAARALASQIADRSDIRYGMACVTTFGDFAEHAPHEL